MDANCALLTVSELCTLGNWGFGRSPKSLCTKLQRTQNTYANRTLRTVSVILFYPNLSWDRFANSVLTMPLSYIPVCLHIYIYIYIYINFLCLSHLYSQISNLRGTALVVSLQWVPLLCKSLVNAHWSSLYRSTLWSASDLSDRLTSQ